jgi:aryl-phospho-beta-D-glucosidase BglC (GH1 family)
VDYSKAEVMNKRLGKGINFSNSWESPDPGNGCLDSCLNNPIRNEDFLIVKEAGFNSIRIPVRWARTASNEFPFTIEPARMEGVKRHAQMAIDLGMPVIINVHHDTELDTSTGFQQAFQELKFTGIWIQIADAFKDFPDDMLVFEIFNEPHDQITDDILNELFATVYNIIREKNPGKTITFNPNGYGSFNNMNKMKLPKDGNLIITGHYYQPITFTHQGHGNSCGDTTWGTPPDKLTLKRNFQAFVDTAKKYFPSLNGGHIPLNTGEFGVSNNNSETHCDKGLVLPSDEEKAKWVQAVVEASEAAGMSWHYWGFKGAGGFEVYNKATGEWYQPVLKALIPNSPSLTL